ncbi:MAG: glycosyltransferase, partial [Myxococcota bacterium]
MHVCVIIPALDEEGAIGTVVSGFLRALDGVELAGHRLGCQVLVADNGSTDATAARAQEAGAVVISAPQRGYGSACLAALAALPPDTELVMFADGDGADDPGDATALLLPILLGEADLVIGSRVLGERLRLVEPGALTRPQVFGNQLATTLLRWVFGMHFSDLGPCRAVSRAALERLAMDDRNFGWTVQMQARAARMRLRTREVPVHYRRRRSGHSKVSGDVRGSILAGGIILRTLAIE